MTDTDSLTAAVKEAINEEGHDWLRNQPDGKLGWADIPDKVFAKAAIAAVRLWEAENGWMCVPHLLTAAQADAATGKDNLVDIHRAMVSASPPPPGSVKEQRE